MGMAHLQANILDVIVQVTFWTSFLFIPVVSTYWQWWRHPYARAAVSIDVLLVLALLPAVLRRIFAVQVTSAGFGWFTIIVLACIPLRTAWLAWMIWRLQRQTQGV